MGTLFLTVSESFVEVESSKVIGVPSVLYAVDVFIEMTELT